MPTHGPAPPKPGRPARPAAQWTRMAAPTPEVRALRAADRTASAETPAARPPPAPAHHEDRTRSAPPAAAPLQAAARKEPPIEIAATARAVPTPGRTEIPGLTPI